MHRRENRAEYANSHFAKQNHQKDNAVNRLQAWKNVDPAGAPFPKVYCSKQGELSHGRVSP